MSLRGVEQAARAPELRHKLLWTFGLLAAYRIGVHVPVPGIDVPALQEFFAAAANTLFGLFDMSPREHLVFAPLIILAVWMGVSPQSFLSFFEASVTALVVRHEAALGAARLAGM